MNAIDDATSPAPADPDDAVETSGPRFEQIAAMTGGTKAGDLSVNAAILRQVHKQRAWLIRRGRDDTAALAAIDRRLDAERAALASGTEQLLTIASIPTGAAGKMTVGGRVTKGGAGQPGLTVSLLGRDGKALGCAPTDDNGIYRIAYRAELEVLVQVSDVKGRKTLALDDRPVTFIAGGVAVRHIALEDTRPCPDGPDTSQRQVMPDLIGQPVEEALARLKALKVAKVSRKTVVRPDSENLVVETAPEAGRLLGEPAAVTLTIGVAGTRTAPDKAAAPDTATSATKKRKA